MASVVNRVGTSSMKPFTPMGEKHLAKSSIEGLIPCILFDNIRDAVIYVRPGRVRSQVEKYRNLGQVLKVPASYGLSDEDADMKNLTDDVPAVYVPTPRPPRKATCNPVICRNTGKFFDSVNQVSKHYKLSMQLINYHLSGKGKQAKGHLLRYAEPEEIEAADKDILWNSGERLPMVTGKRNF